jgi:hypothetical protein
LRSQKFRSFVSCAGGNKDARRRGDERQAAAARDRAEALRPVAAAELNARKMPTPQGGKWHATQVLRLRERLERTQ